MLQQWLRHSETQGVSSMGSLLSQSNANRPPPHCPFPGAAHLVVVASSCAMSSLVVRVPTITATGCLRHINSHSPLACLYKATSLLGLSIRHRYQAQT